MAQKAKVASKAARSKPARPVKATSRPAGKAKSDATEGPVKKTKPAAKSETAQIAKAKAALKKESSAADTTDAPRAPAKSKSRKFNIDISPNEATSALVQKWATLNKKAEQIDVKPYNMKNAFEEKTAITHKVLGWGYILANRNDRLEVLFKDGIKYLISNYKP